MKSLLRTFVALCALTAAISQAQTLLPLQEADIPAGCGCSFGANANPKATLVYWSWDDKRGGVVRDAKGLAPLTLYSEKYIPEQRQPPRVNDRMVVQVANGTWNIQMLGTVERSCAPKAKKCSGAVYRGKLVTLWEGKRREMIEGWGRCGCPQ